MALAAQVKLTFVLDEETSKVHSVLNFVPNYEGSTPPEIFLNGNYYHLCCHPKP